MLLLLLGHCLLFTFLQAATPAQPTPNAATTVQAATPSLADSPTPTDPKELLDLGPKVNGLTGPDVQPWHLKATFEIFDDDGKSKDKGTFEEWWVSDKQYKLMYQSANFSQTEYGTDHGIFRTGDTNWPRGTLSLLRRTLFQPLPRPQDIQEWEQQSLERSFGSLRLSCTALRNKVIKKVSETSPSFCFESTKPLLRYTRYGMDQTLFDHIARFQDRYVALDIHLFVLDKPSLSIHVENLEALPQLKHAEYAPPGDATAVATKRVVLYSIESNDYLRKVGPPPSLPRSQERGAHEFILAATIGTDGRIRDVEATTGPKSLQQPALEVAKGSIYRPYFLNGEAVEVQTEIIISIDLGN